MSEQIDTMYKNVVNIVDIGRKLGSTLGPYGKDAVIINNIGKSLITNDGATILKNLDSKSDPIIEMLQNVSYTQEQNVGDGTTSTAFLGAELAVRAYVLKQDWGIDPIITAKGYNIALNIAKETINKYAQDIADNRLLIKNLVSTTLTGKNTEGVDKLYDLCIDAVLKADGELKNIVIQPLALGDIQDSKLVDGLVIDARIHEDNMPRDISTPRVLVLDESIEQRVPDADIKFNFTNPTQMNDFFKAEQDIVKTKVEKILALGANVVFCQRGIDDYALDLLSRNNILAIRRIDPDMIKRLSVLTSSKIIKKLDTALSTDIGSATRVYVNEILNEDYIFVESESQKVSTIIVGGASRITLEESKRSIDDALGTIRTILKNPKYVYGAGAIEVRVAQELRRHAEQYEDGRIQKAIEMYAEALEGIPRFLSSSCGLHPLIVLGTLRKNVDNDFGIDVRIAKAGKIDDVIEPAQTKISAYTGATEIATQVCRIGFTLQGRVA